MARANRHYLPGMIWHITHRCHKKEFLLKFAKDKRCWTHWLFEAKRRYGAVVLNYSVTSNHIHLILESGKHPALISKTIQLVAGRCAQEYNKRKKRQGAFWEDRYHATAIQSGEHLLKCLAYVDLNMVRTGVVDHPRQWPFCGYNEIQSPKRKCVIIAHDRLAKLCGYDTYKAFAFMHGLLVEKTLAAPANKRNDKWSQSLAVGDERFVSQIKERLSFRAIGRKIDADGKEDQFVLREDLAGYNTFFDAQKDDIGPKNTLYWKQSDTISNS